MKSRTAFRSMNEYVPVVSQDSFILDFDVCEAHTLQLKIALFAAKEKFSIVSFILMNIMKFSKIFSLLFNSLSSCFLFFLVSTCIHARGQNGFLYSKIRALPEVNRPSIGLISRDYVKRGGEGYEFHAITREREAILSRS